MRKGGFVYSVAELSGPVLSEARVYLSMCCGTGSNTAVPPCLGQGVRGGPQLLWENIPTGMFWADPAQKALSAAQRRFTIQSSPSYLKGRK